MELAIRNGPSNTSHVIRVDLLGRIADHFRGRSPQRIVGGEDLRPAENAVRSVQFRRLPGSVVGARRDRFHPRENSLLHRLFVCSGRAVTRGAGKNRHERWRQTLWERFHRENTTTEHQRRPLSASPKTTSESRARTPIEETSTRTSQRNHNRYVVGRSHQGMGSWRRKSINCLCAPSTHSNHHQNMGARQHDIDAGGAPTLETGFVRT